MNGAFSEELAHQTAARRAQRDPHRHFIEARGRPGKEQRRCSRAADGQHHGCGREECERHGVGTASEIALGKGGDGDAHRHTSQGRCERRRRRGQTVQLLAGGVSPNAAAQTTDGAGRSPLSCGLRHARAPSHGQPQLRDEGERHVLRHHADDGGGYPLNRQDLANALAATAKESVPQLGANDHCRLGAGPVFSNAEIPALHWGMAKQREGVGRYVRPRQPVGDAAFRGNGHHAAGERGEGVEGGHLVTPVLKVWPRQVRSPALRVDGAHGHDGPGLSEWRRSKAHRRDRTDDRHGSADADGQRRNDR